MRLHEVMGEYEGEGRICEELGFGMACIHYYQHMLQRKKKPTRPHRDVRKSPEICGDEDSVL
jgi:hypothetical protein